MDTLDYYETRTRVLLKMRPERNFIISSVLNDRCERRPHEDQKRLLIRTHKS